ncbi:MAG: hypothetical protein K2X38_23385 [Gemmataceae bacterium]|nr:hypothetical protein [Gemmataceae bacterium]
MTVKTADEATIAFFAQLKEPTEIRDPQGRVLGFFTPSNVQPLTEAEVRSLFDIENASRVLDSEKGTGSSLTDVWNRIKTKANA